MKKILLAMLFAGSGSALLAQTEDSTGQSTTDTTMSSQTTDATGMADTTVNPANRTTAMPATDSARYNQTGSMNNSGQTGTDTGSMNRSTGAYNAYGNASVPALVQRSFEAEVPGMSNAQWEQSNEYWRVNYQQNGQNMRRYYAPSGQSYMVSLPLMQNLVPQEVMSKVQQMHGNNVYDVTMLYGMDSVSYYQVRLLENGTTRAMTISEDGSAYTPPVVPSNTMEQQSNMDQQGTMNSTQNMNNMQQNNNTMQQGNATQQSDMNMQQNTDTTMQQGNMNMQQDSINMQQQGNTNMQQGIDSTGIMNNNMNTTDTSSMMNNNMNSADTTSISDDTMDDNSTITDSTSVNDTSVDSTSAGTLQGSGNVSGNVNNTTTETLNSTSTNNAAANTIDAGSTTTGSGTINSTNRQGSTTIDDANMKSKAEGAQGKDNKMNKKSTSTKPNKDLQQ